MLKCAAQNVTAIVCTLNAAENIVACLSALKNSGVCEIILVDALSSDQTRKLAKPFVDRILTDPGKGLGAARNLGVHDVKSPYVIHVGPDNVMPPDSIITMLECMISGGYSGVSAVTTLPNSGYLSWVTDLYKRARFYPGERTVIGTPSLFSTQMSLKIPFDENMGFSDDSDLCYRWGKLGHRFAISDVEVQELGVTTFAAIVARYRMYGKSDLEIWNKYAPEWSFGRKLRSILHPLTAELLKPFLRIPSWKRFVALPFLLLITAIRYGYWLKFRLSI